ncbi:MAG: large repetitive protein, partial [Acidimicrobiaceae bacterium]|nr:large repetitive protein [Acidimicrobiaceae bacterium]
MRTGLRIATLLTVAAAAVVVPAGVARADVSLSTALSWPSGAGVGAANLPASFTAQNLNTAPQQSDTLTITSLRLAPSCGAVRSGSTVCPTPDPGVYSLSPAGTGAAGTACAGITFSASTPDASGTVTLTPSSTVVLQPPGGAAGSDRCTVNLLVGVTRVPRIDVDAGMPGLQTWSNLYVQATSSPSGLQPSGGPSLETTVNRGIPGLSTQASVVPPGTSVSDTATLTGASGGPFPTGTVTFSVFGPNDASCAGTPQSSTRTVSNGSATAAFPSPSAGDYRFTASYSGDSNYIPRLAQCNDPGETVTVTGPAVAPPTIAKAFGAPSVPLNRSTTLTFTLANPNTGSALSGVGFSDTLPAGLVVTTPNALTGSCGGGTITAAAGSGSVSLTGAALAANAGCTFSVRVTGTTAGRKNNTTSAVTSVEGGNGATATATIAVAAPPAITKAFARASVVLGGTTTLTFTIVNPAANTVALRGVAFTDSLPAGLAVATPSGLS